MKIKRTGITRTVFVFQKFVIKVPNLRYGYRNFLRALLCNIDEGNTWVNSTYQKEIRDKLLCPVLWYTKTGLLLIMKRADVDRHCDEMRIRPITDKIYNTPGYYDEWEKAGYGGDDKPDNYGYLDNRLVKIDYSL